MKTIVLVEDDKLYLKMYVEKFEESGYEVHSASDGKSGLDLIKKHKPTIVLSDIMLPELNGLQILEAMKKDKEVSKIPFIFLTNVARSDEDLKRGLELGAVGYLVKSDSTPSEIVAKVKELAEAHAKSEDLPERADEKLERIKKDS